MSGVSINFTKGFDPHCYSNRCGAMASEQHFLWGDQPCEELLSFICESGWKPQDGLGHSKPSRSVPTQVALERVYFYSNDVNP